MPFTPSHIAAVLPMMRRPVTRLPFVPTALVIGSMIPDVPLFTSHWPDYHQTHSVAGVLTVDALATCAAVALFHLVFRAPLAELLPRWIADRLPAPFGLGRVRDRGRRGRRCGDPRGLGQLHPRAQRRDLGSANGDGGFRPAAVQPSAVPLHGARPARSRLVDSAAAARAAAQAG